MRRVVNPPRGMRRAMCPTPRARSAAAPSRIAETSFSIELPELATRRGASLARAPNVSSIENWRRPWKIHSAWLHRLSWPACSSPASLRHFYGCAHGDAEPAAEKTRSATALASLMSDPNNWASYGRDYTNQRFSPLDQITTANVAGLRARVALQDWPSRVVRNEPDRRRRNDVHHDAAESRRRARCGDGGEEVGVRPCTREDGVLLRTEQPWRRVL